MLTGHSGKGEDSTAVGIPRRGCCPPDQALDSGHSGDFPGGAALAIPKNKNEPKGSAYQPIASRSPPREMTLRRAWSFTDKREYICTSCDRKKGTRSVYVKYGVGRLKQIVPSPTLLPLCSLAPPGDLEGPLVRAPREATQEPREPLAKPQAQSP